MTSQAGKDPNKVQAAKFFIDHMGRLSTEWAKAGMIPAAAGAFGVFFLRQFFVTLPGELEEAAELDGCNRWQIFVTIALPLARPALVTLFLLSFLLFPVRMGT
ncbi:ABC transporter permease subunit [Streptosporangium roseum]|uniref:ABC transporter permease subunit n=1 Tax=Streptosporangium roseum TaxID=2001 RepID=UPI00331B3F7B